MSIPRSLSDKTSEIHRKQYANMSIARSISTAQTDEEYDYASFSKRQTSKIYTKVI